MDTIIAISVSVFVVSCFMVLSVVLVCRRAFYNRNHDHKIEMASFYNNILTKEGTLGSVMRMTYDNNDNGPSPTAVAWEARVRRGGTDDRLSIHSDMSGNHDADRHNQTAAFFAAANDLNRTMMNTVVAVSLPGYLRLTADKVVVGQPIATGGSGSIYKATVIDPEWIAKNPLVNGVCKCFPKREYTQVTTVAFKSVDGSRNLDDSVNEANFHQEVATMKYFCRYKKMC